MGGGRDLGPGSVGWLVLAGLLLLAAPVAGPASDAVSAAPAAAHSPHCLAGCPVGRSGGKVLVRPGYTLANNPGTKFADWVAYVVTAESIGPSQRRGWKADPDLDGAATLEPADYEGAHAVLGVDRGHQVPLASATGTEHWRQTNLLSNVTPQMSDLNQGPWRLLEEAVRRLARSGETVHVLTGPIYEREMPALPAADEPHRLPSGYWKLVAIETAEGPVVAGFVFGQETARNDDYCGLLHRATAWEIGHHLGLVLMPALAGASRGGLEVGSEDLRRRLGCAG